MAQFVDAARFFTDDDFVWVEPGLETAPTVPATLPAPLHRRRARQTRTLAGDLARLRAGVALRTEALPSQVRALVALAILAALIVLALVVTIRGGGGADEAAPPESRARSGSQATHAQEKTPAIKTLAWGDQGAAVADLQHALGVLGFYAQPVDGDFGDGTTAAVLAFQRDHGVGADGVAGPTTMQALVETLGTGATSDAAVARDGLSAAVGAGRLSDRSGTRYGKLLTDSLAQLRALPPGRVPTLALVFHSVAALAPEYDEPRALTLFSMLKANADYLSKHPAPSERLDIRDADGVVYRFFPQHGFQFHPIADFATLNRLAAKGRRKDVERLAAALVARGIPAGKGLLWEYNFPFGGPSHWTSGFAQATAAQALAHSSKLLGNAELASKAHAAFRGLSRGLWLELGGGLWVREYGFSDMAILNAQLQSLLSLYAYVELTNDEAARAAVGRMASATRSLLPRFDTGCWSRYSLGGSPATLNYHTYHIELLKKLAAQTGDPLWSATASRWDGYLRSGGPTAC